MEGLFNSVCCVGCGEPMSHLEALDAGCCENCDAEPLCEACSLCETCAELNQDEFDAIADWMCEDETD